MNTTAAKMKFRRSAVILLALLFSCIAPSPLESVAKANTNQITITVASLTQGLFVATSAEYNSSQGNPIQAFKSAAYANFEYSCMLKFGFSPKQLKGIRSPAPALLPTNNVLYPNIKKLKKGDLSLRPIPAGPNTATSENPLAQSPAFRADSTKCLVELNAALPSNPELESIVTQWQMDLDSLNQNPEVVAATLKWQHCEDSFGYPARSVPEWFYKLDEKIRTIHGIANPYRAPEVISEVKTFGSCAANLYRTIDRVRSTMRKRLLDRNITQLAQVAHQLSIQFTMFEKKYGFRVR